MDKKVLVDNFCNKYNVDRQIVLNYIDCVLIGDLEGMDVYYLIMLENIPDKSIGDVRTDLKELLKNYFDEE